MSSEQEIFTIEYQGHGLLHVHVLISNENLAVRCFPNLFRQHPEM